MRCKAALALARWTKETAAPPPEAPSGRDAHRRLEPGINLYLPPEEQCRGRQDIRTCARQRGRHRLVHAQQRQNDRDSAPRRGRHLTGAFQRAVTLRPACISRPSSTPAVTRRMKIICIWTLSKERTDTAIAAEARALDPLPRPSPRMRGEGLRRAPARQSRLKTTPRYTPARSAVSVPKKHLPAGRASS